LKAGFYGAGMFDEIWTVCKDGDLQAQQIFRRHYSFYIYKDGRHHKKIVGPGEYIMLITAKGDALFVWRKFKDNSGQQGINCSIFRNESNRLSSEMILAAEVYANRKWPNERLYTYINPRKIKSKNPGCCFIKAGWQRCGITKRNALIILEKYQKEHTI
jgi:hypothetical protein